MFLLRANLPVFAQDMASPIESRLIRRAHLFTGLFLAPWVLVFGVSALVIHNRPSFSGWPKRVDVPMTATESILAKLPSPEAVARQAIAGMNTNQGNFQLSGEPPRFEGALSVPLNWGADGGKGVLPADRTPATISRYKPTTPPRRFPAATTPAFDRDAIDKLRDELQAVFLKADPTITKAGPLALPQVRFVVTEGDNDYVALCDLTSGNVTLTATGPSLTDLLPKLHMTHKYVPGPWYRDTWLVFANLVGFAMCFWVLTGLAMWWRMGVARRSGLAILMLTSTLLVVVTMGMSRIVGS